jgi:hypothetical protein
LAGPTLRQAHRAPEVRDGLALGGGPTIFFKSSRSAAASSIRSGNSFFSRVFPSSSAFRRLASQTPIK